MATGGQRKLSRREAFTAAGGAIGVAALALWRKPFGLFESDSEVTNVAETAEAAKPNCVLTPEQTEGPYHIPGEPLRRNVTEGRPGTPLQLRLKVLDSRTCKPIKRATVEIWHADAGGEYSGFGNSAANRTFMRGRQRTNKQGVAAFDTIYPGWYQGRTVHIHTKVHVKGSEVHTGQLYFDDSVSDAVFADAAYAGRGTRQVRNADDGIFEPGSTLKLAPSGSGYVGRLNLGVRS